MFRFILILTAINYSSISLAGWFGPSNKKECIEKYIDETNFRPGKKIIGRACSIGYVERNDEVEKVARCVLSDADELYSDDSAYKIINECSKKYKQPRVYNWLSVPLRAEEMDLRDRIDELEGKLRGDD
jgi:hypothetical protein